MRYRINQTTPDPPWRRTLTPVTQCLIALGLQELQTARKGPDVEVREGAPEAQLDTQHLGLLQLHRRAPAPSGPPSALRSRLPGPPLTLPQMFGPLMTEEL